MRHFFSRLWHNFRFNFRTLITFELLYKLFTIGIIYPLIRMAFQGILKVSGLNYITGDNLTAFLTNPLTIALTLGLLLVMAVYSMIDISAAIFIYDRSEVEKKTTLRQTLVFSLKNAMRTFSHRNFLIGLVMLFMIPFLNIGVGLSFIGTVRLPGFWVKYIRNHLWLGLLVACGIILMVYFILHWLYSFSYFTLEKKRFRLSRHFSRVLSKGNEWAGITALAITQGIFWLLYQAISHIGVLVIVLIERAVEKVSIPGAVFYSVIVVFLCAILLLIASFAVPVSFLIITTLFYHIKEKKGFPIIHVKAEEPYRGTVPVRKQTLITAGAMALAVILSSAYIYGLSTGKYSIHTEGDGNVTVTAHRGASRYYPENTMAAFKGARKQGADMIELDVRASGDGVPVVVHDENLRRVTGVDKRVWELTCDQIEELDAGSYFSPKYAGEKIPLLLDVIRYARRTGMKLNIEIKPTGHADSELTAKVVAMVKKYGLKKKVVISSTDYNVLRKVKELDLKMKTAYITSLAYGDLAAFPGADAFSIEASSVSRPLVHRTHQGGGEVYAWTVNEERLADDMVADGVDSIITDDVPATKGYIYDAKSSAWYGEFVRALLGRQ